MDNHAPVDREPTLQDALSTIARQAIRISHLEAANEALRKQLEASLQSKGSADPDGNSKSAVDAGTDAQSDASNEILARLRSQYEELEAKHSLLESAHSECGPMIEKYQQKLRDAKQRCKEWKAWREKKKQQGQLHEDAQLDSTLKTDSEKNPQPEAPSTAEAPTAARESSLVAANGVLNTVATGADVSSDLPSSPPKSSLTSRLPRITSSQSTVEETAEQASTLNGSRVRESGGSDPVVVSARPVKRKAGRTPAIEPPAQRVKIKQEPNSPETALDLRSDDYSSPKGTPQRLNRTETTNLDTVGPCMHTPRRRHFIDQRLRATSEEAARAVPRLARAVSSYSDGGLGSDTRTDVKLEPPSNDQHLDFNSVRDATDKNQQRPNASLHEDALRPLSVNVPAPSRKAHLSTSKPGRKRTGSRGQLALLSEAGDEETSQVTPRLHGEQQDDRRGATNDDRLDDLLNERSPEKTPTFLRQPISTTKAKRKAIPSPNLPTPVSALKHFDNTAKSRVSAQPSPNLPTPVSAAKRVSPVQRKSPAKRAVHQGQSPPPIEPEQEPLRIRGLDRLGLEDFRINPNYIGTEHAVADTFRGREQRRNLQVSKKPELDKAVAMSGGPALSGKTDAQALLSFLGPNWEDLLGNYRAAQRKDIVAQAHVHCFTTQHGKQRQAFERRKSPPGFWDTDFPTTQEAAQNRAKAREMEREQVAERWRDAMRGDGRWIFRDE